MITQVSQSKLRVGRNLPGSRRAPLISIFSMNTNSESGALDSSDLFGFKQEVSEKVPQG